MFHVYLNYVEQNVTTLIFPLFFVPGLYDTVFDVDHDRERAKAQGLEPNGFSFDGTDTSGVAYALDRWVNVSSQPLTHIGLFLYARFYFSYHDFEVNNIKAFS